MEQTEESNRIRPSFIVGFDLSANSPSPNRQDLFLTDQNYFQLLNIAHILQTLDKY